MTAYQCRDCGHPYGTIMPTAPVILLHRTVSHSDATPIVEMPVAAPQGRSFTKYAQDDTGSWFAVTLQARNADEAAPRFAAIFAGRPYQYFAPEGFAPIGVQA